MEQVTLKNLPWKAILRPIMCSLLVGAPLIVSGCRKAAVDKPDENLGGQVQTNVVIGEPAYLLRPQNQAEEPWYRSFQVVLEKKAADEKELEEMVNAGKAPVLAETRKLLEELNDELQDRRKANDKWAVLTVTCGRGKKVNEIYINADVGLTKLYARRPVIAFNEMPLDLCVAKLSRESGIHDSQPRGYNPRVFWSKTNVSAIEAYDGVLKAHGFEYKFSDVGSKLSLRLQDFESRQAFIDGAIEAILAKGKALNSARPAIIVSPREAPAPADTPAKDGKPRSADFKDAEPKK